MAIVPSPTPPPPPPSNVNVSGTIENFYGRPCVACHVDLYALSPTLVSNLGSGGTLIETNPVRVETNGSGVFNASVVGGVTAALYVEETMAVMKFTLPSSGSITLAQIQAQQPNVVSTFPPLGNLNMGRQPLRQPWARSGAWRRSLGRSRLGRWRADRHGERQLLISDRSDLCRDSSDWRRRRWRRRSLWRDQWWWRRIGRTVERWHHVSGERRDHDYARRGRCRRRCDGQRNERRRYSGAAGRCDLYGAERIARYGWQRWWYWNGRICR